MKKTILSIFLFITLFAGSAMAETVIKGFIPAAPTRPDSKMMAQGFGKIEEFTNGELKVDVFYAGGMGFDVKDLIRHIKKNTVQLSAILPAYYPRELPALSIMFPDGIAMTVDEYEKFVPTLMELTDEGFKSPWNFEVAGYFQPLFLDHSIFSSSPIKSLAELRTKKLRVWTKHQLLAFKALGVSAQIIPKEDLFVALQTGVVDAALYLAEVAPMAGLHEVAKYEIRMMPWISTPMPYVMGRKAWNALTPAQQKAVKDAGAWSFEDTTKTAYGFRANVEKNRQARVEKGFVDNGRLSDGDMAELSKALRVAWKEMAQKAGDKGMNVYTKINSLITN